MTTRIHVKCKSAEKVTVDVNISTTTVKELKELLAGRVDVAAEHQRLIYRGKVLKDENKLVDYGLEDDQTIHLVRGLIASNEAQTGPVPAAPVPAASLFPGAGGLENPGFGTTPTASTGAAFASLFGGAGGLANPGFGTAGAAGSPQANLFDPNNLPESLRSMVDSPAMQRLFDPNVMDLMIRSNPQLQEVIERNPEIGHALRDPAVLRQSLQAASNPEIMREMMRSNDRAISNIMSMPGGFDAVRRMHQDFDPLLTPPAENQTTIPQTENNQPVDNSARRPHVDPNSAPLPNPWGSAEANSGATAGQTTATNANNTVPSRPGLGSANPFMPPLPGGEMNFEAMMEAMQNPMMQQVMQQMSANPQLLEQMMRMDPRVQSMLDSNPEYRALMTNPEFLRQLTDPAAMQQIMQLQSLLSQLQMPGAPAAGGAGGNNAASPFGAMLSGGFPFGAAAAPPAPVANPEEAYAQQLAQLQDMGFFDTQENIRALTAAHGNVNGAVERLLSNL